MIKDRAKITIEDVAERAGVSTATVSRVLNQSPLVAERTREQVRSAIEEMRFRPDRTARALAGRRTETFVVALPTFTTPFHNELLKGVREALRNADMELLIWDLEWRNARAALSRFLSRGAVSGLLLVATESDENMAKELSTLQSSVVLVGAEHAAFDSIYWDDVGGARLAMAHLLDAGHRRVGMICATPGNRIQERRIAGYREALEGAGVPYDPRLVVSGHTEKHAGYSEESGYEAMEELLALDERVTAIFAGSDVQALGAWKAVTDAGLSVPHDVALVGYDDIKLSRFVGLSSVDQSAHAVGRRAAERLLERIRGDRIDARLSEQVVPRLRIRSSTQRAAWRRTSVTRQGACPNGTRRTLE